MMVNDIAEQVKNKTKTKLGFSEFKAQAVKGVGDQRFWIFLLETFGIECHHSTVPIWSSELQCQREP